MIKFRCPGCQQKLNVSSRLAGRKSACPKCKQPLSIPADPNAPKQSLPETAPSLDEFRQGSADETCETAYDDAFPDVSEFLSEHDASDTLPAPVRRTRKTSKPDAAKQLRGSEQECQVCGKVMFKSDRFCVACGHNHFDAVGVGLETQQKMHDRLDQQAGGLIFLRWLRVFSRFFR